MIMSGVRNKLKVFNPVIISNGVFVMHKFPTVKVAVKVLSHYKAMLSDIACMVTHQCKETIGRHIYKNITLPIFVSPAFPVYTPIPLLRNCTNMATIKVRLRSAASLAFPLGPPSTLIANWAHHPNEERPIGLLADLNSPDNTSLDGGGSVAFQCCPINFVPRSIPLCESHINIIPHTNIKSKAYIPGQQEDPTYLGED